MTDSRLDAEHVETLVLPDNAQRRLSAEHVEALVLPDNAQRRLSAEHVETLVLPDNAQRRLDCLLVEVLIPTVEASPVPLGIVAVGADTSPVWIKHDDGVWRVLRVHPLN